MSGFRAALRRVSRPSLLAALAAGAVVIALDQASKWFVVWRLNLRERGVIEVLPVLDFRMAWNTGVNFGLMSADGPAGRALLIGFTFLLALALLAGAALSRGRWAAIGLGIAAGGALGNLVDRILYGAVADFLNVSGFGVRNPWSFNVADVAIFAGLALAVLAPQGARKTPG